MEVKELLCESAGCLLLQKHSSFDFHDKSINTFPSIPTVVSQTATIGSDLNDSYLALDEFLCLFQLE